MAPLEVRLLAVQSEAVAARPWERRRVPLWAPIVNVIGAVITTGAMVVAGCAPAEDRTRCLPATAGKAGAELYLVPRSGLPDDQM